MKFQWLISLALCLSSSAWLTACSDGSSGENDDMTGDDGDTVGDYEATIRYTEYGVPHILAEDWEVSALVRDTAPPKIAAAS